MGSFGKKKIAEFIALILIDSRCLSFSRSKTVKFVQSYRENSFHDLRAKSDIVRFENSISDVDA